MKDSLNLMFERNNYYTGKLLSANDFTVEQNYINNKRRLLNVFNVGSGILYGLNVIETKVKEKLQESFCIRPGVAIDSMGREIVLQDTKEVLLNQYAKELEDKADVITRYICLKYKEEGIGDKHEDEKTNKVIYSRWREKYEVAFEKDYNKVVDGVTNLIYRIEPIYMEDNKIRVLHKSPKYINPGKPFECSFIVLKFQKDVVFEMNYKVKTENLEIVTEQVSYMNNGDTYEKN